MEDRNEANWIESFLRFTDDSEAPYLYRKWCAISTVAACLQRKCYIDWHTRIYPNFYIILSGPTGHGKSTAINFARRMLAKMPVVVAPNSTSREGLIKRLSTPTETQIMDEEEGTRIEQHASVTVIGDELAVFIGYGQSSLVSFLTNIYDYEGDAFIYETIKRGTESAYGAWLNILGGMTPSLIKTCLPQDTGIEGGLTARVVFVYAEKDPNKMCIFPFLSEEDIALGERLLQDLEKIIMLQGGFTIDSTKFMDRYADFYIEDRHNPPFPNDPYLIGYNQRRRTNLLKLCMVLSASKRDDKVITYEDICTGIDITREVEKTMQLTFSGYGRSPYAEVIPQIMAFIGSKQRISFGQVLGRFIRAVTKKELEDMIATMRSAGFCDVNYEGGVMYIQAKEKK